MNKIYFLYAFLICSVIYVFSSLFNFNNLELIFRPLVLPLLLAYYLTLPNNKRHNMVSISFGFYFVAEMLVLLFYKQYYLFSGCLFLVPYFILLYHVIIDFISLLNNNENKKIDFVVLFVVAILTYLVIGIFLIIDSDSFYEQILYYVYGFVLIVLPVFSVINYLLVNSKANFFLILTTFAIVVTNLFYVFIVKFEYNLIFNAVKILSQLLSYYFFIQYAISNFNKSTEI